MSETVKLKSTFLTNRVLEIVTLLYVAFILYFPLSKFKGRNAKPSSLVTILYFSPLKSTETILPGIGIPLTSINLTE